MQRSGIKHWMRNGYVKAFTNQGIIFVFFSWCRFACRNFISSRNTSADLILNDCFLNFLLEVAWKKVLGLFLNSAFHWVKKGACELYFLNKRLFSFVYLIKWYFCHARVGRIMYVHHGRISATEGVYLFYFYKKILFSTKYLFSRITPKTTKVKQATKTLQATFR